MTRVSPPAAARRQGDDDNELSPFLLTLIDKWLHNPVILFTLFAAFLATLTALVLITGQLATGLSAGLSAGLGAVLFAAIYPAAKKARNRTDAATAVLTHSEPFWNTTSKIVQSSDDSADTQQDGS